MLVFEIVVPGIRLELSDPEISRTCETLLYSLESEFFAANLALNLVNQAQSESIHRSKNPTQEEWSKDMTRRQFLEAAIRQEMSLPEFSHSEEVSFQADIALKREKWQQGVKPREFDHQLLFMHAKSFLSSLDMFDKLLGTLVKEVQNSCLNTIHAKMGVAFPNLRGVRNSAQHLEDRVRGLGPSNKGIKLQPVDNQMIKAPTGALILNNLIGNKYGSTMADGHYGEVEVSAQSMTKLQEIFQEALDSLCWRGSKRHLPSAF